MQMLILGQVSRLNNLFLFDVDGTLSVNGIVPKSAKEVIKKLRANGDLVFLCTGRCLGQMTMLLKEIKVDGVIANNGAFALCHDEIFYEQPIDFKIVEALLKKGLCVGVLTNHIYGVLQSDAVPLKEFCDFFHIAIPVSLSLKDIEDQKIYSLGVYTKEDITNTIDAFKQLHFMKVCPVGYDVVLKGVSKASAIQALRRHFSTARMIGFGDNYNDWDMLLEVDVSVVMPSAPSEILAIADYVTRPPLEDGILYAIEELLRIQL